MILVKPAPRSACAQGAASRPILYVDLDPTTPHYVTSAVYPDGRRLRPLAHAFGAAWSPDGTSFAYVAETPGHRIGLRVQSLDGATRPVFTAASNEGIFPWPMWSPDSRRIAVIVLRRGGGSPANVLTIIGVDDRTAVTCVTIPTETMHLPYYVAPPNRFRWSPDGRKILVSWERATVVHIETRRLEHICAWPVIAEWAPDSNGVYYVVMGTLYQPAARSIGGGCLKKLGTQDPVKLIEGSRIRELGLSLAPVVHGRLVLSPSGSLLALATGSDMGNASVAHVFDLRRGRRAFAVASTVLGIVMALDWAPDGQSMAAAVVSDDVSIELLDLATETWTPLASFVRPENIDALGFNILSWTR